LDNCLLKFDVKNFVEYRIQALLNKLVEHKSYPVEVRVFDTTKLGLAINCSVWDIERGTLLTLGEGHVITRALLGFYSLTPEEIV
jgi:hypothetical protein